MSKSFRSNLVRRARDLLVAHTPPGLLTSQVAALYSFPKAKPKIATPVIAIVEFGGGFSIEAIRAQFESEGLPAPSILVQGVGGAANDYTGDPEGPDGEVELDIVVAAAAYSYCTGEAAKLLVIFAPNSSEGSMLAFHQVSSQPVKPATCSDSWGGPEDQWTQAERADMDSALKACSDAGIDVFAAAGDSGSGDGERGDHADFPGSSPHVVCCGGTTPIIQNGKIVSESPWNAGGGATGGGYSAFEPVPTFQQGVIPPNRKRGVPDISALANPVPGYATPFGAVGGTSAVAPLMAGLFAACRAIVGSSIGPVNKFLYAHEPLMRDIVAGNNGDFSACKGWDPASGLGSPDGSKLLSAMIQTLAPAPTPAPSPAPAPTPAPVTPNPTPVVSAPPPDKLINALRSAVDQAIINTVNATYTRH